MPETDLRDLKFSVKKDDYEGSIQFIVPYSYYGYGETLPPSLPEYNTMYGYYHSRDTILLRAPRHEGQWANAVGVAIAKMASLAWEVEGSVPLRINKARRYLLNAGAGMGLFGWVPFLSMHLRAYLATGRAFIEIERASKANGSKVINVHHLNPLRCRLTGNAKKPVNYLAKDGKVRELHWHQVMICIDLPDPTEGEMNTEMGATERAYPSIIKMAAIERYVYEKVSGRRPQALYFLGGATKRAIADAIATSEADADRRGVAAFLGAAVTPIMGDVPLNLVTIPLAELPDGFDAVQERLRTDLLYANAIGLDPQDLNPELVGRQGLGSTGNQSLILAEKQKGRGLNAWKQQFVHQLNELALDDKTMFTFKEPDLRDEKQKAENAKIRAETQKVQIESGVISTQEAKNIAVDQGDIPREFLADDATGGDALGDTDKPLAETKPADELPAPATKAAAWDDIY